MPPPADGYDNIDMSSAVDSRNASIDPGYGATGNSAFGGGGGSDRAPRSGFKMPKWVNEIYDFNDLGFDVISGLTAGVMMLPQGLAFAGLTGLPALYGVYPGFVPALVYSLCGPSKQASVGPEALKSQLVGQAIYEFEMELRIENALVLSLMFGAILFVMGFLRLGFVESLLSKAVVNGFIFAVAVEIAIEQLPLLMGVECEHECHQGSAFQRFLNIAGKYKDVGLTTLIVAIFSVSFLWGFAFFKTKCAKRLPFLVFIPEILLLVVIGILVSWLGGLDVNTLGEVDGKFVAVIPKVDGEKLGRMMPDALIIALVSYIESIVVAKKYANEHRYRVSSNKELMALGLCNVIGSFFGSYGAQGSLPRSVVQNATGAKNMVALFTSSMLVGGSIAFLMPLFRDLPEPCMGAIVFVAALSLMEFEVLQFFWRMKSITDFLLWLVVFGVTVFVSIPWGIQAALAISLMLVVKQTARPSVRVLGKKVNAPDGGFDDLRALDDQCFDDVQPYKGVHIFKLEGHLFFANMARMQEMIQRVQQQGPGKGHGGDHGHEGGDSAHAPLVDDDEEAPAPARKSKIQPAVEDEEWFESVGVGGDQIVHTIILDMTTVTTLDATALHALFEGVEDSHHMGQHVHFVYRDLSMSALLLKAGIGEIASLHDSLEAAVASLGDLKLAKNEAPVKLRTVRKGILRVWKAAFD